jgi:hypothetical protein
MAVWYSLWSFDTFFQLWSVWTKKNLATLQPSMSADTTPTVNCETYREIVHFYRDTTSFNFNNPISRVWHETLRQSLRKKSL